MKTYLEQLHILQSFIIHLDRSFLQFYYSIYMKFDTFAGRDFFSHIGNTPFHKLDIHPIYGDIRI